MDDGPVGVGVGPEVDVHPTSAPAASTSIPSVRYIGTRRNSPARCRTTDRIPIIASKMLPMNPTMWVVHGPRPAMSGMEGDDPAVPFLVGIALIVIIVLVAVVPCARVAGLGAQVAPVRDDGKEHEIVTSAGSVAPDGLRLRFI